MAFVLPILTGLYYREDLAGLLKVFVLPLLLADLIGLALWLPTRTAALKEDLRDREAFVIVGLTWLIFSAFGALPYLLNGILGPLEAYFESMSGFTTTGITMLDSAKVDPQGYFLAPRSLLLWRAETQWLGGMGIILFSTVILARLIEGASHLVRAEMPGIEETRLRPRVAQTARLLWSIYLLLTLAEVTALYLAGLPLYDAVAHAFTTLPSGGFSPKGASIASYDSGLVEALIMAFMFIAGVNFVLFYQALVSSNPRLLSFLIPSQSVNQKRGPLVGKLKAAARTFTSNTEFRVYVTLVLLTTSLVSGILIYRQGQGFEGALRDSLFAVLSVITTTGYTTADFGGWPSMATFVLLLLMFTGACAGSTAGGLKLVRLEVLLKGIFRELRRAVHPKLVQPIHLNGRPIPESTVTKVAFFFFLYMFVFLIGTMLVLIFEPHWEFMEGMSAVATSMANIGPALGTAGPSFNFHQVSSETKLTLISLMWLGRLEIITALMLFFPSTYRE